MTKTPDSMHLIRFMHCDPFNHLGNTRYLDYFINAREDHLLHSYGFDIYDHATKTGESWVVAQNQIAYLAPARAMEKVLIQSSILEWKCIDVLVEMQMWNEVCSKVKALLWTRYVHVSLRTQKRTPHSVFVSADRDDCHQIGKQVWHERHHRSYYSNQTQNRWLPPARVWRLAVRSGLGIARRVPGTDVHTVGAGYDDLRSGFAERISGDVGVRRLAAQAATLKS